MNSPILIGIGAGLVSSVLFASTMTGSVLAMALALTAVVGALIVSAITVAILQSKNVQYQVNHTEAFSLAEGVTELAQKQMLDEFMKKYKLQDQDWRKKMMKK